LANQSQDAIARRLDGLKRLLRQVGPPAPILLSERDELWGAPKMLWGIGVRSLVVPVQLDPGSKGSANASLDSSPRMNKLKLLSKLAHDLDVLLRHRLLPQPGGFEGFPSSTSPGVLRLDQLARQLISGSVRIALFLEPFLQPLAAPGNLVSRLPTYNEGHKQLADPVTLEVEIDRHAGSRTVLKRLNGAPADRPDRTVDATEGISSWWVVLRQLQGHRPLAATDLACLGHP
jgi:hypothetical protein